MKIKRYIANDAQEAMVKVKAELGTDAVILHSRKIKRPGFFGFFKRPLFEIVAAIEEDEGNNKRKIAYNNEPKPKTDNEHDKFKALQNQLDNMQGLIINFMKKDEKLKENKEDSIYNKYFNIFIENDVDDHIAYKILNIAKKQINFTHENEDAIRKTLKLIMKEYFGNPNPILQREGERKTFIFVGPTGVGKTTTLAKLAAKMSIVDTKKIGLITSDTYRIAAIEQLRTYSEILGVELKVIYEPNELNEALRLFKNKDVILIDTAGRNHKIEDQLKEAKEIISLIENPEIFLVMSATTTYKDVKSIINSYGFLDQFKLIFTKLDESTTLGNILNTKIITGKEIAYFTTGQIVPDDIEIASPDRIVNSIVGE
ncbi:MAG: flagellar biosynthesis protein FlhF [Alkaliphilus sp.]|nr:flagellar biosynthesis protein FlhF [Alkaliphilus sp.]